MNRKESVIGGLDRILSAHQVSALLGIPAEDLLPYYSAQDAMSLRNLLKKICWSNPVNHFPIIGETTYTLKGVMSAIGKGRSWTLVFLEMHNVQNWCLESITCTPMQMLTLPGRRNLPSVPNGFLSCRCPVSMGWIFMKYSGT